MRGNDCKEYLPSTIVQMRMRNLPCRSNSPHLLEQQCRDPRSSIQPQGQPHCSIVHGEFLAWLTYGNICIPRKTWPKPVSERVSYMPSQFAYLRKAYWFCQSHRRQDQELQQREGRGLAMCVPIDKQWGGFRVMIGRFEKRTPLGSVVCCRER